MEDWGDWKPGLQKNPLYGVVLAALTSTAPLYLVDGSKPVHGPTPAEIGLSPSAVTAKVSPRGAERCSEPVTGGPANRPWPIGHQSPARPDQQALVGRAGGMKELPAISSSEAAVETGCATTPPAGSDKSAKLP